jgi:hypothetical protein
MAEEVPDLDSAAGTAADWPTAMVPELASGGEAASIEAASLAALAGGEPAGERAVAEANELIAVKADDGEIGAAGAEPAPPGGGNGTAAEDAVPAPGSAAAGAAGPPVQTVREKPANPRRGWWQRLVQP